MAINSSSRVAYDKSLGEFGEGGKQNEKRGMTQLKLGLEPRGGEEI